MTLVIERSPAEDARRAKREEIRQNTLRCADYIEKTVSVGDCVEIYEGKRTGKAPVIAFVEAKRADRIDARSLQGMPFPDVVWIEDVRLEDKGFKPAGPNSTVHAFRLSRTSNTVKDIANLRIEFDDMKHKYDELKQQYGELASKIVELEGKIPKKTATKKTT